METITPGPNMSRFTIQTASNVGAANRDNGNENENCPLGSMIRYLICHHPRGVTGILSVMVLKDLA